MAMRKDEHASTSSEHLTDILVETAEKLVPGLTASRPDMREYLNREYKRRLNVSR